MGRDNTLISLFAGHSPEAADMMKAGEAVRAWADEEGLQVVEATGADEQVVLVQIAGEPWITPLRTGFEMDEDTARAWACSLSKHSGLPVVGGVMHDSDLLELFLVIEGRETGRLDVSDLYFEGELSPQSGEEEEDLTVWQAVAGAGKVGRLRQLWSGRAAEPYKTLAGICALLGMDTGGAEGFGAARWFITEDSLEAPAGQSPAPIRILARFGLSE